MGVLKGPSDGEDTYGPRDVLNEMRYRDELALERAVLRVEDRAIPGGERVVPAERVAEVGRSFLEVADPDGPTRIPHHRVTRIDYDGEPVWRRLEDGGIEVLDGDDG